MDFRIAVSLLDLILVYWGFLLSFLFRFPGKGIRHQSFQDNFTLFPFLALIYVFSFAISGVYRNKFKSYYEPIQKIVIGMSFGLLLCVNFVYVFRMKWGGFPSSIFFLSFPIIFAAAGIGNVLLYKFTGRIFKKDVFLSEQGLKNIDKLLETDVDEIVLATKNIEISKFYQLVKIAEFRRIKLSIIPKLYDEIVSEKINNTRNKPLFILPVYFRDTSEGKLIRAFDIVAALLMLLLSLPLLAFVTLLIKLDSSGPVIYKQQRMGLNGKPFMLYKFRSMILGAKQFSRPQGVSLEDDSRVTIVGRFIRKTRLDELPQIFNVLIGDMSLVGPRPEAIYRVKEHRALQGIRLSVRPGLTGLAQIKGNYHTIPRHKLHYDYLYIRNRCLWLNCVLLFKTVKVILSKHGS